MALCSFWAQTLRDMRSKIDYVTTQHSGVGLAWCESRDLEGWKEDRSLTIEGYHYRAGCGGVHQ
jgi:hypothetical protein